LIVSNGSVITDVGERAAIMLGDAYLGALEQHRDAFVFEAFAVVLEPALISLRRERRPW
jgi:hypothetical protein